MRLFIFLISTLVISLSIPLFSLVYFTPWYSINTPQQTTAYLGQDSLQAAHTNLTRFFLHTQSLSPTLWSPSEIIHMHDVRKIYDQTFLIFVLALLCTTVLWEKKRALRTLKRNIFITLLPLALVPVFSYFWSDIFHNILFSNDFWVTTPDDLSYYLFPLSFFIKSLITISVSASLINLILYKILTTNKAL